MKVHLFCAFCMCHKELITWESTRTPEHNARHCVSFWPQCHVTLLWPGVACIWSRKGVCKTKLKQQWGKEILWENVLNQNKMHWECELLWYVSGIENTKSVGFKKTLLVFYIYIFVYIKHDVLKCSCFHWSSTCSFNHLCWMLNHLMFIQYWVHFFYQLFNTKIHLTT